MYNAVVAWIHNYAELDGTLAKHAKGDVQRNAKGRKKPQAIRQARKRTKQLKKRLI